MLCLLLSEGKFSLDSELEAELFGGAILFLEYWMNIVGCF